MQSDTALIEEALLPAHVRARLPAFHTQRFAIIPLNPGQVGELAGVLLQDTLLVEYVPWVQDKSCDGALREAFLLQMQCAAGTALVWGIVERESATYIGALLARPSLEGLDVEVLCASEMWNQGVAEEAGPPVADWLEENCEVEMVHPS